MYYEVRGGDTLSAIARRHGTSIDELQRMNRIADPDRIRAGQRLDVPAPAPGVAARSAEAPSASGPVSASSVTAAPVAAGAAGAPGAATAGASADMGADADPWSTTVFRLVDAIGSPIVGLLVRLRAGGGRETVARTDADGCVAPFRCDAPGERIEVHVGRAQHKGGGEKLVGVYVPLPGSQTVKVQSAKQVATTRMRRHDGPPAEPPRTMKRDESGGKIEAATRDGHPLTCVKCGECPNDEDLKLGVNAEYREHIVAAARRAGLTPQAVAGLINAEAEPESKTHKWKRTSKAVGSSATGLTQFIDGTWVYEALRKGTRLHEKAVREGWLSWSDQARLEFVKSDGTRVTGVDLGPKLVKMIPQYRTATDSNLQKLLNLREDAEFSVAAAVDYGSFNLGQLRKRGYAVDTLNEIQAARVMYLCHHLGIADAVRFIQHKIPHDDVMETGKDGKQRVKQKGAKSLLIAQIGEVRAIKLYVQPSGGDWVAAHRQWLDEYVNRRVVLHPFVCSDARRMKLRDDEQLYELQVTTDGLKK